MDAGHKFNAYRLVHFAHEISVKMLLICSF